LTRSGAGDYINEKGKGADMSKGGNMSRRRMIQAAVVALVLVASAPIAHAGGGGAGGIAGTFLFDCYLISGVNPPHELDLSDQFFPENPESEPPIPGRAGVKLGKAKLLCTPASAEIVSGELNPGFFGGENVDHIKCYEAPPKGANPNVTKVVADPFVTETVTVGVPLYVCVGAFKCDVGEACPPSE
jgi:hypothetical protein